MAARLDPPVAMKSSEVLVKPLVFPDTAVATVVCRHQRCVPASGSAQRDLQTSSRGGFHTDLELGVQHSMLQDPGKVRAGVLGTCIPIGITLSS